MESASAVMRLAENEESRLWIRYDRIAIGTNESDFRNSPDAIEPRGSLGAELRTNYHDEYCDDRWYQHLAGSGHLVLQKPHTNNDVRSDA